MSLLITKPGLLTTVQDIGRFGAQKYGVIVGGAMDAAALRIANLLVGNDEGEAGLEITMLGPEMILDRAMTISICGGDLSPKLDGEPVPMWRTVFAAKGSCLQFGTLKQGCRAYLAVGGGLDIPVQMGSRSTYLRAGIGGFQGRALRAGDRIPLRVPSHRSRKWLGAMALASGGARFAASRWSVSHDLIPPYAESPATIQVLAGQEIHLFREESVHAFFNATYTVLPQSDRMGYRLTGETLELKERKEMISSAVTFGTIQVPSDGKPIVLMADRQTTGGYPKIAQVITADLPLLSQVNLGGRVRFCLVSLREAQKAYVMREQAIQTLRCGLEQRIEEIEL
ncbi:5-oxoprolinase subunit C [Paenibacillus solanacearum]|uniref:5-oxoprolinase subunit C n=1 Tax=Paenibacillus solanacearum TaxID=2048548 RepID=A0A916K116_9BACL|nr:biotin-dependent carboxyltransferase family protein [Paenibacillus solanacearum]CAG7624235.1 5-oxoprolinase subunit C [Paenibacillus solanacearum]